MDAGYRGRAAPCQRERSDRALDRVTAIDTRPLRHFVRQPRSPPFGLLAEAVPQQPRAGNRPVSEARPAPWTYNREHRDMWSRQIAPAPPNRHNRLGKTLNRPLGSLRPGLHGLPALSRVLDLPCVTGRRGMSAFSRDLYFFDWADQPAQRPDTRTGA